MKIKKLLVILGVAAIGTMAFVGCSTPEETTEVTESATTEESVTEETTEEAATEEETTEEEVAAETEEANELDGVYRVEYEADQEGWKTFLEVTVADGAIANVNFDEVNVNDEDADNALEQALLTATTPEEFEQMLEGEEEAEAFKKLVAQAMTQIQEGNKDITVVN